MADVETLQTPDASEVSYEHHDLPTLPNFDMVCPWHLKVNDQQLAMLNSQLKDVIDLVNVVGLSSGLENYPKDMGGLKFKVLKCKIQHLSFDKLFVERDDWDMLGTCKCNSALYV